MKFTPIVYTITLIISLFLLALGITYFVNFSHIDRDGIQSSENTNFVVKNTENRNNQDLVMAKGVAYEFTIPSEKHTVNVQENAKVMGSTSVESSGDVRALTIHMVEDQNYGGKQNTEDNTGSGDDTEVTEDIYEDRTLGSVSLESYPTRLVSTYANSDKEVMGFLPYWQISKYQSLQYDKLTSIAYFALTTYDNGEWVTNDPGYTSIFNSNGTFKSSFIGMINLAHQNNTRVDIVVKNFHNRSIRDLVANKNGAGDKLINNIVKFVRDSGVDGVNIDFEYIPDSSYPVNASLRSNFVAWHDKLAKRMHSEFPGSIVSTDVFGSSAAGYSAYDIAGLGATDLDYIMFMTYDYILTSCYEGKRIFPMSPLYGNTAIAANWNVSYHLTQATKQAPSKKVLMGVPYYGIDFAVRSSDFSLYNARIDYPNCSGVIETYGSIVSPVFDAYHNPSSIKWNDAEKSTWYSYIYGGRHRHGYYDDPKSLGAKYDFVRSAKLGGIGIWALGYDSNTNDLWNVLRDKFQRGPYIIGFRSNVSGSRSSQIFSELKVDVVSEIGNNVYRVRPRSGITTDSITKARNYFEVLVAEFENVDPVRDIILP